jgi:hypothetical protein
VRQKIVTAYCEEGKRIKDIHRMMLASLATAGVGLEEYPYVLPASASLFVERPGGVCVNICRTIGLRASGSLPDRTFCVINCLHVGLRAA